MKPPETGGWRPAAKEALLRHRRFFEEIGFVTLGAVLALGAGLFIEWRNDRHYEESFRERLVIELPIARSSYDLALKTMQRQLRAAVWILESSGQAIPDQASRVLPPADPDTSMSVGRALRTIAYPTAVTSLRVPVANDFAASGGFARLDDRDLRLTIGLLLMAQDGSEIVLHDILASQERVITAVFDAGLGELLVSGSSGDSKPALPANVLGAVSVHATLIAVYLTSIQAEVGIVDEMNSNVR